MSLVGTKEFEKKKLFLAHKLQMILKQKSFKLAKPGTKEDNASNRVHD